MPNKPDSIVNPNSDMERSLAYISNQLDGVEATPPRPITNPDSRLEESVAYISHQIAEGHDSELPEVSAADNGKVLGVVNGEWDIAEDAGAILPEVTASDNGKALGVVNGEWGKMPIPSGLPAVTASDNGKVLGVSSGVWAKVDAPSGLPEVSAADEGEVLTVNSSGEWEAASPQGDTISLDSSTPGEVTITVTHADGTTDTETVYNGQDGAPGLDGADGANGADGYSPTINIEPIAGGNRITIYDAHSIPAGETFDVLNGSDGEDGAPGGYIINIAESYTNLALDIMATFQSWLMAAIAAGGTETTVSNYSSNTAEFFQFCHDVIAFNIIPSIWMLNTLWVPSACNGELWSCSTKAIYPVENVGIYSLKVDLLIVDSALEISGTATAWTAPTPPVE